MVVVKEYMCTWCGCGISAFTIIYVDLHNMHEGADLVKLCQNIKGEILDHFNIVPFVLKAIHKTDVLGIAKKEQGFMQYSF